MIQYEIILVNLDPSIGSEMRKTRPAVVISPNEINRPLNTLVIAPITNSTKLYPTRLEIKNDNAIGWIALDQIRTIDKQRVVRKLGQLEKVDSIKLKKILKETFVD